MQRVLITAGAGGIGREIARAFAAQGGKIYVCDIDEAALTVIRKEIPGITAAHCDMASRTALDRGAARHVAMRRGDAGNVLADRGERGLIDVADVDLCALRGESARDFTAYAARAGGDQNPLHALVIPPARW